MKIPDWFREWTAWAGDERWMLWLVTILAIVIVLDIIHRRIVVRLSRRADQTPNVGDDILVGAMGGPISVVLWVLGASAAIGVAGSRLEIPINLSYYIPRGTGIGLVVALSWFGFKLAQGVEQALLERYVVTEAPSGLDRTTVEGIGKVLRALALVTALLLILQSLGVSISGLVAVGGVGGVAIAFAARDLLANFFGSVMIHVDGPFKVGDWIRSPDRELEGVVEYIGWRVSRVRTFDMRPLYIPNSVFVNVLVENPSRMSHRRFYETIGIRYDDVTVMSDVVSDIRDMIEARDEVDLRHAVIINFLQYNESSLDILIYFLVTETRWGPFHVIKQEVLLEIANIIASHGAQVAFPTSTLHVASTPGGEPVEGPEVRDTDTGSKRSADATHGEAGDATHGEAGE